MLPDANNNKNMMLQLLHRLALRLLPLYSASLLAAAVGSLVSAGLLLGLDNLQALAIRFALLLTMWALTLFAFINLFKNPAPVLLPALSWSERMLIRLQLGLYYFMALGFCVLVAVVFSLSVKMLMHG